MSIRENLANYAHQAWSGWMRHLFDKSDTEENGAVTLPPYLVTRWKRQMGATYDALSVEEKISDRAEADRMIKILAQGIGEMVYETPEGHAPPNEGQTSDLQFKKTYIFTLELHEISADNSFLVVAVRAEDADLAGEAVQAHLKEKKKADHDSSALKDVEAIDVVSIFELHDLHIPVVLECFHGSIIGSLTECPEDGAVDRYDWQDPDDDDPEAAEPFITWSEIIAGSL